MLTINLRHHFIILPIFYFPGQDCVGWGAVIFSSGQERGGGGRGLKLFYDLGDVKKIAPLKNTPPPRLPPAVYIMNAA